MYGLTISASTIFQLTTSRRGRLPFKYAGFLQFTFQLTTSRRGRPDQNPALFVSCCLSTHDLTQRSTFLCFFREFSVYLSTHDLTQRSTCPMVLRAKFYFLSTHDLTQRSTRMKAVMKYPGSLSTHDLTQRSTTGSGMAECRLSSFNSRPHAEVDLTDFSHHFYTETFQLTTSRRGRPSWQPRLLHSSAFNSRPHAEVDRSSAAA